MVGIYVTLHKKRQILVIGTNLKQWSLLEEF